MVPKASASSSKSFEYRRAPTCAPVVRRFDGSWIAPLSCGKTGKITAPATVFCCWGAIMAFDVVGGFRAHDKGELVLVSAHSASSARVKAITGAPPWSSV